MFSDFVLKALDYGVLGLCAVMLIASWRILSKEQARKESPRRGVMIFTAIFMAFCVILAGVNAYVQLNEAAPPLISKTDLEILKDKLTDYETRSKLYKTRIDEIDGLLTDKLYYEVENAGEHRNRESLKRTIQRLQETVEKAKNIGEPNTPSDP